MRRLLGGVQSAPRVMRGAPVSIRPDYDVPLSRRALGGLESQGLAKTLGSLSHDSIGADEIPQPPQSSPKGVAALSRTQLALAAVGGAGLIYFLSKRR